MRFLRLLANGLICGIYFCFLLALLVVDLNINHSVFLDFPRLALFLFPTYGFWRPSPPSSPPRSTDFS